ncbi:MAG TPA: hypothetical protein VHZ25_13320 [Acidobacteriaceae bacterium]|jgi:hypothetical protein|nr:hypothetical protein [Acidobacteriaceae bacterium]
MGEGIHAPIARGYVGDRHDRFVIDLLLAIAEDGAGGVCLAAAFAGSALRRGEARAKVSADSENRNTQNQGARGHLMKRLHRSLVVVPAIAILLAGCSSTSKGAAGSSSGPGGGADSASGTKADGVTYVSSPPLSNQLTTGTITDPSLNNMVAATLKIPAGWKLQGIEMISPCTFAPWPVFRAYSPDGLMQYRMEPVIGWQWNPSGQQNNRGCAKISGAISAADFLQSYVGTIEGGVHVMGTMPVPAAYSQWAQGLAAQVNQNNSRLPQAMRSTSTTDTAALRVEVMNGSFVVEERLRVATECSVNSNPGPANGGTCWARVDVLTAPEGKLDALVQVVDSNHLPDAVVVPEWQQAVLRRLQQQNAVRGAAELAAGRAESAAFSQMMDSAFQQSIQRSASEHAAFMQQQESSFESSMNNARSSMNARSTAASDWVDYALDQQTVSGPGGDAKVSNQYSLTWKNGTQWYQTNDPNANPNGTLSGNWTLTTQVHGNGQAK